MPHLSFGIATAPQRVGYVELLRVWREADTVPEIEHAWLFDHLMPIGGDRLGPIFEGWTLLSALAAQTRRLRLGLLVTSNRFRPPAVLAKIATTVDVVSDGRLEFGIGAGSRTSVPEARREYDSHGLPYLDFADSVDALAEACTVIKRLWTESEPFDFDGCHVRLAGAFANPKPVQRPHPPILIAGRTSRVLRVVAEHADAWNIAGVDIDDATTRSALLDCYCTEIGREPASITRSFHVPVSYDDPATTRDTVAAAIDAGFTHIVLSLSTPYPDGVARWVADEISYWCLLRRRQELSTTSAPFGVHGLDVLDADVEEAADTVGVGWRLQSDRGLVVGRASAPIDDDPAVGQRDVRRFSGAFQRATEHVGVEAPRALDVVRDDEVSQHNSLRRRSELGHLPPPLVGTHTPLTDGVYGDTAMIGVSILLHDTAIGDHVWSHGPALIKSDPPRPALDAAAQAAIN